MTTEPATNNLIQESAMSDVSPMQSELTKIGAELLASVAGTPGMPPIDDAVLTGLSWGTCENARLTIGQPPLLGLHTESARFDYLIRDRFSVTIRAQRVTMHNQLRWVVVGLECEGFRGFQ